LVGSQYNDTLTGDGNDNFIEGGLGNDALAGGLGSDTASYAGATAGVTVSLASQGVGQNTVNAGTDTLSGFENLAGSAFNDSLTGDATPTPFRAARATTRSTRARPRLVSWTCWTVASAPIPLPSRVPRLPSRPH
jgi:Ca2+-binding RTX toxin-like protein